MIITRKLDRGYLSLDFIDKTQPLELFEFQVIEPPVFDVGDSECYHFFEKFRKVKKEGNNDKFGCTSILHLKSHASQKNDFQNFRGASSSLNPRKHFYKTPSCENAEASQNPVPKGKEVHSFSKGCLHSLKNYRREIAIILQNIFITIKVILVGVETEPIRIGVVVPPN